MTAAATPTLAAEFQKPVTQWTCAEFLAVDDEFKPTIVFLATTFAKAGQEEAAAIDTKGIERVTQQIRSSANAPKRPRPRSGHG
jgi:acid stress chaperone HdeA